MSHPLGVPEDVPLDVILEHPAEDSDVSETLVVDPRPPADRSLLYVPSDQKNGRRSSNSSIGSDAGSFTASVGERRPFVVHSGGSSAAPTKNGTGDRTGNPPGADGNAGGHFMPLSSLPRDQLSVRNLVEIVGGSYLRAAAMAFAVLPFIVWMTSALRHRLTQTPRGTLGRPSVYNTPDDGVWNLVSAPLNYEFLALRAVLFLFVNGLSLVVVQSTYGWKYAKQYAVVCYLPMSVLAVVFTLFIYETVLGFPEFVAAQIFTWTMVFILLGSVWLGRAASDPRLKYLLPTTWLGYLVVAAVYYFFVPVFFSRAGGEIGRAAIRILLHPIIFEIASLYGRHVVRQLSADVPSPDALWTIVLPIMALNSLFGRLLMFTMSTFTGTIVTTVLLGALEITMRLTTAKRDKLAFRGYDVLFGTKSKAERIEKEHKEVAQRVVEASHRRARAKARGPKRRWTVDHGSGAPQPADGSVSRRSSIADDSTWISEAEDARSNIDSMIPTTTAQGGQSSAVVPANAGLRFKIAFYTELGQIIGPSMIAVDSITEAASIMTMTCFIWFMRLSLRRGARIVDSPGDVLVSGAVQLATELVTDIICLAYELRKHGNAHVIAWRERYHRHFFALLAMYVCITAFFIQATISYLCGATTNDGTDFETFYCES